MPCQKLIVICVKAVFDIQLFLSGSNNQMQITIFLWSQQRCVFCETQALSQFIVLLGLTLKMIIIGNTITFLPMFRL